MNLSRGKHMDKKKMFLIILSEITADVRNSGIGQGRMDMLMKKIETLRTEIQNANFAAS